MNRSKYKMLYFDDPATPVEPESNGVITSGDLEPAISIDHVNRLVSNINTLRKALGITSMTPMAAGTTVKRYKKTVTLGDQQENEGDLIPLTQVKREPLTPLVLDSKLYRKQTSLQAIQKTGRAIAINETDEALIQELQKNVRNSFFTTITATGSTAAAGGATLQKAAAQAWASLNDYFEDKDVTPIYFVNPFDVADALGDMTITTQTAFGFSYIENFLGMGNAFVTPRIPKKSVYATATQNINGVYIPNSGDVADVFDLTYDESGLIGMTHAKKTDNGTIETMIALGVLFYTEDASGVVKSTITASVG